MRKAVHAIIIQNRKIFVVQKGIYSIFPGGKIEAGESDEQCLIRESAEELSGTKIKVGNYYKTFTGITPNSNLILESKTYFCYVIGELRKTSNEVSGGMFISSQDFPAIILTEVSKKTLDSLVKDNLID